MVMLNDLLVETIERSLGRRSRGPFHKCPSTGWCPSQCFSGLPLRLHVSTGNPRRLVSRDVLGRDPFYVWCLRPRRLRVYGSWIATSARVRTLVHDPAVGSCPRSQPLRRVGSLDRDRFVWVVLTRDLSACVIPSRRDLFAVHTRTLGHDLFHTPSTATSSARVHTCWSETSSVPVHARAVGSGLFSVRTHATSWT